MIKNISFLLLFISILASCKDKIEYDLIITDANILDVKTGKILSEKTLCIKNGRFQSLESEHQNLKSKQTLDAKGKLITPSFIDTHIHPISEFSDGDYDMVPDTIPIDSTEYYRSKITDGYLPDGTSTVLMMGHPDSWTNEFLKWTNNSKPTHVDVFTCGGALATEDGHTYKGHHRLLNPEVAKKKIIEYHDKGIEHLKLYWRLKEPEFKSIQHTADSLDMKMFAHSGGFFDPTQLNVFQAMDMGIRSFEHIAILPCSVFDSRDWEIIHEQYQTHFRDAEGDPEQLSLLYILETFKHAEEYKQDEFLKLIDQMAENKCDISTTIGWVYKTYHETFFAPAKVSDLTPEQFQRCEKNFAIIMKYLNMIHEKGMPIRIGSDTKPGGKIVLLELMLMIQYGMSAEDAIKIATINGAKALGLENEIGSIEVGKKANFIIWQKSPIDDYQNFIGEKIIVKDGKVF